MKKRRIFIYVIATIILICGIGYAYLNTDLSLENNVTLNNYESKLLSKYIERLAQNDH